MKKILVILIIFATFAMKSFGFQSGDLFYTIISTDPPCVRVDRHVAGHAAQGELIIPETVTHEGVVYTVTTIKENAFYMCHITSVVFSERLTTIEAYAFESCHLTSLHIPAALTSIGAYAFVDNKFESITVDEANPVYDSRDNCNALIETATNTLITGCHNTIIPNTIVIIGSGAYIHCEKLKSINIPEHVIRIENNVFEDCDSLETVVLPTSLTFIGNHAFSYCGLTSITSKALVPPTATYDPNDPYYYDSFLGTNRTIPIYIPFGTIQAYSQASGWNRFSNFIEEDPILYTDFEPDPYLHVVNSHEELCFDLDGDSVSDVCLAYELGSAWVYFYVTSTQDNLMLCYGMKEGDIIALAEEWNSSWTFYSNPDNASYMGFRIEKDGNYYYGWFRTYGMPAPEQKWYFDKFAYCTIPNYPLEWGQTTLTEDVEEKTMENAFSVYPNPAQNVLFVETQCFASQPTPTTYHITNLMGQTILTGCINADCQQINIENLPVGFYFITAGEKTVKFVKQ